MRRVRNVLVVGAALWATSASAEVRPLAEDAAAFGAREAASQVALSPSGNKALFLVAGPAGSTGVKVYDLNTGQQSTPLRSQGTTDSLYWCDFGSETVLVCKFGGMVPGPSGLVPYSRLIRVGVDGKDLKPLGQSASFDDARMRQFDGSILDWLPDSQNQVLMEREYIPEVNQTHTRLGRKKNGLGIDMVDLESLRTKSVEQPNPDTSGFMTDGRGAVRIRYSEEMANGYLTGKTRLYYRPQGGNDWKQLGVMDGSDPQSITPLAVEAESNSLFFLKKLNGRQALYRMPLDGSNRQTLVASNDKVDIDGVTRLGRGQKVIGYTFADESRHAVYFDPEFDGLAKSLGAALQDRPSIDFVDASANGQNLLVFAGSDVLPGSYYYLDRKTRELSPLADVRPPLGKRKLSPVKAVSYRTRDGATIPAYLTLPAGSTGKGLPAVVLPHGGPSSRDEWGFDWLAQFLAARGYAVIQPNYRGSAGFGEEFENGNGFQNWQTSISDVNEAATWLVSQGIADKSKVAIVGWSYGGYAALQSAEVAPDLYKAVVAIAPVTDLALVKSEAENFTNADLVKDFIGSGEHVRTGSPVRNAAAIKAPVLLVHGDLDLNVGIAHSVKMESALKAAHVPVEFLRYPKLDHQLDDSNARAEMLNKIGQLLGRTIGN